MSEKKPSCAMEECPRFAFCCVNDCSLSLVKYESLKEDNQNKCTLAKSIRTRLGLKWNLKNKGLTARELNAQNKWDSLSAEEKQARIKKLQEHSPITRLASKGYAIAPRKKNASVLHIQQEQNSVQEHSNE